MSSLHEILDAAARAALKCQAPDGSLPAGHNGPYGHPESPARNTGHWLVSWLAAWRRNHDAHFREAAFRALNWLTSEKARSGGASFLHRDAPGKDACNGLIGQAWSIEALATAAEVLGDDEAARIAERLFLAHPFDAGLGLWHCLEVDGRSLDFDVTFNHQLWFAAAGTLLAPHSEPEVGKRVAIFLDRLDRNLAIRRDGIVVQWISAWGLGRRSPRYAVQRLRNQPGEARSMALKEYGYHAFNLYAFGLLHRSAPQHGFWRSAKFERLWAAARTPNFRARLDQNEYAWPYNPVGFEMAFALNCFEGPESRDEQAGWIAAQLARHWDPGTASLRRHTPDPNTLTARLYEAAQLPDLPLSASSGATRVARCGFPAYLRQKRIG
jgi:hypothetical protein